MQFKSVLLGSLAVYTVAAGPAAAAVAAVEKRQTSDSENDAVQSIESVFKSVYGISSFPTDTATLMSVANELISAAETQATESGIQSAYSALMTAVPSSVFESIQQSGIAPFTATAAPAWFSSLAPDLQSNILSQQSVARSVVTAALKVTDAGSGAGAAPTSAAEAESSASSKSESASSKSESASSKSESASSKSESASSKSASASSKSASASSKSGSATSTDASGSASAGSTSSGRAPHATAEYAMGLLAAVGVGAVAML